MKKFVLALCFLPMALFAADPDPAPLTAAEATLLKQVQLINQVPEAQLNDKTDPGFSILRSMYDEDGPDFSSLRKLLGDGKVRSGLNPSAKCLLANVISQRWDTFGLSGNLYLAGLRSSNPDLRDKARKKLVCFIQPAHIPALIDLLKVPGPNVLAYDILQEVTGQHFDPGIKIWQTWWAKNAKTADLVGHLIKDSQSQLASHSVHSFDQERFWYLPQGVSNAQIPYAQRPAAEQTKISDWILWVNSDVKRYVDDWSVNKPILDRIVHQPDPRVNQLLETLLPDPGMGDYASVVLGWRASTSSMDALKAACQTSPSVGKILARGSMGDKTALVDLLEMMQRHASDPLTYKIMDDDARLMLSTLRTVGIVPAEQAFELLAHHPFDFKAAVTPKEKKKAFKAARTWLKENATQLKLDHHREYYTTPPK